MDSYSDTPPETGGCPIEPFRKEPSNPPDALTVSDLEGPVMPVPLPNASPINTPEYLLRRGDDQLSGKDILILSSTHIFSYSRTDLSFGVLPGDSTPLET